MIELNSDCPAITMVTPPNPTDPAASRAALTQGWFYTRILPWLVLAVSLLVTYQLWNNARQNAVQLQQIEFDAHVHDIVGNINKRMKTYEQRSEERRVGKECRSRW